MTTPDPQRTRDAREGSGDPRTDPAAAGERRLEEQDGDGGAVADDVEGGDSARA